MKKMKNLGVYFMLIVGSILVAGTATAQMEFAGFGSFYCAPKNPNCVPMTEWPKSGAWLANDEIYSVVSGNSRFTVTTTINYTDSRGTTVSKPISNLNCVSVSGADSVTCVTDSVSSGDHPINMMVTLPVSAISTTDSTTSVTGSTSVTSESK